MEQDVVQGLAALLGGLHEDLQVVRDGTLPGELPELLGAKGLFQFLVRGGTLFSAEIESFCHGAVQK